MRKLIDMGDGDMNAKKIHYDNLWHIVRYCENINDCRYVFTLYGTVWYDTIRYDTVAEFNSFCWEMTTVTSAFLICRRVQQLQYFGEVFDHGRCGEMANMRCDNCFRNLTCVIEKVGSV